jgi:hypothetical protein
MPGDTAASPASPSPNHFDCSTPPRSVGRAASHAERERPDGHNGLTIAYRVSVPKHLPRIASALIVLALMAGACGADGGDVSVADPTADASTTTSSADGDDDTPTSTTTAPPDETTDTTTTAATLEPLGDLAQGSLTTAGGVTTNWSLTASTTALCFEADLSHPDPGVDDGIGEGVSACLEPDGGLDELDSGLSVDVGTVDGEKTIGFLWGRVAPEVISLTIEHTDGTQTPVDILEGPTDVGVFAYVVEIATIPPVQDLDAVSGTQIEGSEPIRGFLRSGPTYPVVTPPPVTAPPDYPVS